MRSNVGAVMARCAIVVALLTIAGCGGAPRPPDTELLSLGWLLGCWRDQGVDSYVQLVWLPEPERFHGVLMAMDLGSWSGDLWIERADDGLILRDASVDPWLPARTQALTVSGPLVAAFGDLSLSYSAERDALIVSEGGADEMVLSRCCHEGTSALSSLRPCR